MAILLADRGDPRLQLYLSHRQARFPLAKPLQDLVDPIDGGGGGGGGGGGSYDPAVDEAARENVPTPSTFPSAIVFDGYTFPSAYGNTGSITSSTSFLGTHGANTITLSAKDDRTGGTVVSLRTLQQDAGMPASMIGCYSSALALASCSWMGTWTTAVNIDLGTHTCGTTITASAAHDAWFGVPVVSVAFGQVSLGSTLTRWGDANTLVESDKTGSNLPCTPPRVSFVMKGGGATATNGQTLTLSAPGFVSFSSTSVAGSAPMSSYSWYLDGALQASSSGFGQGVAAGTHSVRLDVRDQAGLSASATATLVIQECEAGDYITGPHEDDTIDGSGSSGNCDTPSGVSSDGESADTMVCSYEYIEIEISFDNGVTWYPWWSGYVEVCE